MPPENRVLRRRLTVDQQNEADRILSSLEPRVAVEMLICERDWPLEVTDEMIERAQLEARRIGMPGWRSRESLARVLRAALKVSNDQ